MLKKVHLLLLFCTMGLQAQALPDKMSIIINTYAVPFNGKEYLYSTDSIVLNNVKGNFYINAKKLDASPKGVAAFMAALDNPMDFDAHFKHSGLDTLKIKNSPEKLLDKSFKWTPAQRRFILPILNDISNYKSLYEEQLYTGFDFITGIDGYRYKTQFVVKTYSNRQLRHAATSNLSHSGYALPWVDTVTGTENYNPALKKLAVLLGHKINNPSGTELTKSLAKGIIKQNSQKLNALAAETFSADMDDLKQVFEIEKARRNDRTIKDQYIITLHNNKMLPNVHLNFYASAKKDKLYTPDSIKADYEQLVSRIQNITFISDYLKTDPNTQLYINYYNNTAITGYDIDRINKNPKLWAKHDKYVAKKTAFAEKYPAAKEYLASDIKYSVNRYCSCNLRLEEGFIKKGITFEIRTGDSGYSTWVLLPDDRVLLYTMQGETLLNFKYDTWGNKHTGVQTPCRVFDTMGNSLN